MRVLITGMGGELGTRVATLVGAIEGVEAVLGLDVDPPRRRVDHVDFHRVDPRNRLRAGELVRRFAPTHVLHLGTYEPDARCGPGEAVARTASGSIAVLGAAADAGALEAVVVRSGIEVYGRRRGSPLRPDEDLHPDPTSPFGHSLLHAERMARLAGDRSGAPVTLVRCGPIVGPHFPSPLGRYLRHPIVPFSPLSDAPFSVLHQSDAAAALVAAMTAGVDGPVNVVGPGAVTASQAARIGGRVPVPVIGPAWRVARLTSEILGAPVPEHVHEALTRGRVADGSRASALLGVEPAHRTPEVIEHLFEWADITWTRPHQGEVAA